MPVQAHHDAQGHGDSGRHDESGQDRNQTGQDLVGKGGGTGVIPDPDLSLGVVRQNPGVPLFLHGNELVGPLALVDVLLPELPRLFPDLCRAREAAQ